LGIFGCRGVMDKRNCRAYKKVKRGDGWRGGLSGLSEAVRISKFKLGSGGRCEGGRFRAVGGC